MTSENKPKKYLCAALLAHVDAGKTTLAECMLYTAGAIRKMGRVDNRDAYLDTDPMERERGITIFSKQAVFSMGDMTVTLLDTPGHVDFSAETERTLAVLDYAVLLVSAADGVQGHTRTLWRLLRRYGVPVFLFVNKMDQPGADAAALLAELRRELSEEITPWHVPLTEADYDAAAMCGEEAMERYIETGSVPDELLRDMIAQRRIFPCFFGSALKNQGVDGLLAGLECYTRSRDYGEAFGARVFKIARDGQGNRLTYLKLTGGTLAARTVLEGDSPEPWREKVNQIWISSGDKYTAVPEATAGQVVAVTGLTMTRPGDGLGTEAEGELPILEPVLTYRLILPPGYSPALILPKLRLLEEEEPQLHILWQEETQEILVQLMGEVQTEILQRVIKDRFGVVVEFGTGKIVYKETVTDTVEGMGHFEPLRHYAEAHVKIEPGERGSGVTVACDCSEDLLERNWQRLIMAMLSQREHRGVLTGAALTDVKLTVIGGRAHPKHTEGGDFRQAAYRAVRQGLMKARSCLLEPYYEFRMELPEDMLGRAMHDVELMQGKSAPQKQENGMAVLTGRAPVSTMQNYQKELSAYTGGRGRIECTLWGYDSCHNPDEVIEAAGYDPLSDMRHTPDSVFCAHGSGYVVPWNEVEEHMHVPPCLNRPRDVRQTELEQEAAAVRARAERRAQSQTGSVGAERAIGTEEIDAILERSVSANKRDKEAPRKGVVRRRNSIRTAGPEEQSSRSGAPGDSNRKTEPREEYLLVDGYNVIYAWDDLKELAAVNLDGARGSLQDTLCDYQALRGCQLIVVFDAYRVSGHKTEIFDYHNIHVVFTKEAETADQYIEKFAHENGRKYRVTVATSDGLEQIIIRGEGCRLISSRELKEDVERLRRNALEQYEQSGSFRV